MHINTNWRPDTPSLLLGILFGVGLAVLFVRLLPALRRQLRRGRGWVAGKISWMRSGVEVRFQSETAEYAQKQHLGADWDTLDQIFVPPPLLAPIEDDSLLTGNHGLAQMALLWPEQAAGMAMLPLPLATVTQLLQNGRRVILCGVAGAGKSTLLAHLAQRLAKAVPGGPDKHLADTMPVLLHLAEIEWQKLEANSEAAPDPLAPLATALQKRSSSITAPGVPDMLRRKLAAGQLFLLLDGWAELPPAPRTAVLAWLRQLLATYPKTHVFVTAAPEGYGDLLSLGFTRSLLLPWRVGQVRALIAHWSKELSLPQSPLLEQVWQPGQTVLETSLRFWLAAMGGEKTANGENTDNDRLSEMEMLTAVLPLFQPRKKGQPFTPPDEDVLAFWAEIAFTILNKGRLGLAADDLNVLIAKFAMGQNGEGQPELDKSKAGRLRKSITPNRLFVRWANGQIGLRCMPFRDYLTAVYLAKEGQPMMPTASNTGWRGVWRHYAALADPSELAAHLLPLAESDPLRDSWFHMAGWLAQSQATGNWRRQLMINLGQLARQADQPELLRLRAMAAMAHTGEEGLLTFVNQLLGKPDPFLRQMATAVLPLMHDDKVIGLLAERLADSDLAVRLTAVSGLALLQHHPLTERPLVTALIGENEEVSLLTAELLAGNGGPGLEILQEAVKEEDIQVRRAAVHGLSLLDEPWLEPLLTDLERNDSEWIVRSAASGALDTIRRRRLPQPWRAIKVNEQPWLENLALSQGKRVPSGAAGVAFVTAVFNESTDAGTRVAAVRLLAQLPAQEALPVLQAALADGNTAVQVAAFQAYCALRGAYEL